MSEWNPKWGERGKLVGWCNTCGADVKNGIRHRCPKRMDARIRAVVDAARDVRRFHAAVKTTSNEFLLAKAESDRLHAIECLIVAVDALSEGTEAGPE